MSRRIARNVMVEVQAPISDGGITPCLGEVLISYCVITAGYSGLMAMFDDDWQLTGWTPCIRSATIFETAAEGNAVIRRLAQPAFEREVLRGRAVRVFDSAGEAVYLDISGQRARRLPTPAVKVNPEAYRTEASAVTRGRDIRSMVRELQRDASRNPAHLGNVRVSMQDMAGTSYRSAA